eukprot:2602815-Amphidinium_carterae.1
MDLLKRACDTLGSHIAGWFPGGGEGVLTLLRRPHRITCPGCIGSSVAQCVRSKSEAEHRPQIFVGCAQAFNSAPDPVVVRHWQRRGETSFLSQYKRLLKVGLGGRESQGALYFWEEAALELKNLCMLGAS